MKTIRFIIPYFGDWPSWFPLYLETCAWNPTIEWLFFTDCPIPVQHPENVSFVRTSLEELSTIFSQKLKLPNLKIERPYKLCDFKPAYGFLFQEYLRDFQHWAHGDIDVIYGDLRSTLTDDVLNYDLVSFLRRYIAGHLTVYKNSDRVNNLFRKVPEWELLVSDERSRKMDETHFTKALQIPEFETPVSYRNWDGPPIGTEDGYHFFESWNTPRPFLNYSLSLRRMRWRGLTQNKLWRGQSRIPNVWHWKAGRLTNNVDDIDLPYLHFMHWNREEWKCADSLLHGSLATMKDGFRIDSLGFSPSESPRPHRFRYILQRLCCLRRRLALRTRRLLGRP